MMFKAALAASAAFLLFAFPAHAGKAGFHIDPEVSLRKDGTVSIQRIEPGLTMAIRGDVFVTQAIDVALFALPNPLPPEWAAAIAPDQARSVPISQEDGKVQVLPLQPVVFRALFVPAEDGPMEVFNAVLTEDSAGFFVLLPYGRGAEMWGTLSVISSDARYLLTSQGMSVDLMDKEIKKKIRLKKGKISEEFFETYPSPMPAVGSLTRDDDDGKVLFAEWEKLFPERYLVGKEQILYSARPNTGQFLERWTPLNSFGDRYVSCGNASIGSGGPVGLAFSVVMSMPRVLSSGDCLASGSGKKTGRGK